MMSWKALAIAVGLAVVTVRLAGHPAVVGKPGLTAVPCAEQAWTNDDPSFVALAGAKASFGRYDGGVYRVEIPANWNGELVLWAHGYTDNHGPQGSRLRVGFPGTGQGSPFRAHLIERGFAWAAASYRCNGYVPGQGLLDTMALTDVFTKANGGKAPARTYLTGASMGGHITVLGLQEFPTAFAGGLAMCASGPGEMDFLTAVGAASELVAAVAVSDETRARDVSRLTEILGKPPDYTRKGRQLASIQVQISGGPRPFAIEGLASRFIENATAIAASPSSGIWGKVATNSGLRYDIDDGLDLTASAINTRVRRKAADADARSARGPYEEAIPFDGRFERPLLTIHGTGDLYVPVSLEQLLKRSVDAAGASPFLVQRLMRSPGHCNFSAPEQNRAFDDLVTWARQGVRPEGDDVLGDLTNAGMRFTMPLRPGDPGTARVTAAGTPETPAGVRTGSGIVLSELVFDAVPFASAHASTIAEIGDGLVAAWFGGTREGAADVGIWLSRHERQGWTAPIEVATGVQPDGTRQPCWNPVLFTMPDRTVLLFYKVGPSPQRWWGLVRTSRDDGRTWSDARRLPDGFLGPIKNKPVRLADGALLAPSSTESPETPSAWRVHFERTLDGGLTWTTVSPPVSAGDTPINAIQPSILVHPRGVLQAVGRTRSGRIFETWSRDDGRTWSALALTALPNPSSGIDAVTLRDGRHLIVYNHTAQGRSPLNVALSRDGVVWEAGAVLESEPGEYSYPAVIQTSDGLVHVTYTWKRQRIKHVVLDPATLRTTAMPGATWPADVR